MKLRLQNVTLRLALSGEASDWLEIRQQQRWRARCTKFNKHFTICAASVAQRASWRARRSRSSRRRIAAFKQAGSLSLWPTTRATGHQLLAVWSMNRMIANRKFVPHEAGDSKTKLPLLSCAALAIRTQFATMAFARITVAGNPPSFCGTHIGCSRVRRTCGAPGSKRAADHVEHGGDATTAMHSGLAAKSATRSATSSRASPREQRAVLRRRDEQQWGHRAECTPLHRSGATTAAVLRRLRIMLFAIVPSSSLACVRAGLSASMLGGDGARVSSPSLLSSTMMSLSLIDGGAVGWCVLGPCGMEGGTGGECWVRPGKVVSMNRACGDTYILLINGSRHMCLGWLRARPRYTQGRDCGESLFG
eukprot:6189975-Pleurochrysis_carterae.AAC.1